MWFCGIIVLRSPVFLIMTSSPFKVAAIISITVKKRFTTKLKLIHGQHWHWLAASLSLKSCLDDQNGTLKKSFLEFFSPFCKNFDTMTCNFFEALFDFQKLHSSFFVTFQPKFLLHFLHLLLRQFRTWHPPPPPSPTSMFGSLQGSYFVAQW